MNSVEQTLRSALSARAMSVDVDQASLRLRGQEIAEGFGAEGVTAVYLTRVRNSPGATIAELQNKMKYAIWLPVAACAAGALALSTALFAPSGGDSTPSASSEPAVIESMTRAQGASDLPAMRGLPQEVSRDSIRLLWTTDGTQFLVGSTADGRTCLSAVAENSQTFTCTMGSGLDAGENLKVELPSVGITAWLIPTNSENSVATQAGAREVVQNLWVQEVPA